jgi:hypothetical protein
MGLMKRLLDGRYGDGSMGATACAACSGLIST